MWTRIAGCVVVLLVMGVLQDQRALVLFFTPTTSRAALPSQELAPRFMVHPAPMVERMPPAAPPTTVTPGAQPLTATIASADTIIPISDAPARFGTTSSDGRYVLYEETSAQGYALLRRDLVTHEVHTLHAADGTLVGAGRVYLSPDDSTVLYETATSVRSIPLAGGVSREILPQHGCRLTVKFTPTSAYAVLLLDCVDAIPDRLVTVRIADGTVLWERDLASLQAISVQPEGDYVLATRLDEVQQLVVHSITGAIERVVNVPAGQTLAFVAFTTNDTVSYVVRSENDATIYRLDLRSAEHAALGTIKWDGTFMALSKSRDVLVYVNTYSRVSRFLLNSGTDQLINSWDGDSDNFYEVQNPVVSPTGDHVAFSVQHTFCHIYCKVVNYAYTATFGGVLKELTDSWLVAGGGIGFSSDGRYLLVQSEYMEQVILVAVYDVTNREPLMAPLSPAGLRVVAGTRRMFVQSATNTLETVALNQVYTETLFSDGEGLSWASVGTGDQLYFYDHEQRLYVAGDRLLPLSFTAESALVGEGRTALVTVTLESMPLHPVTAQYALTGGTATEGEDFTFTPGTLTFAPFERTKTFTVELVDDGVAESVETAVFSVSTIEGGSAGEQTTYTLNIADEVYEQSLPMLQRE